jgi:hypothetical protein
MQLLLSRGYILAAIASVVATLKTGQYSLLLGVPISLATLLGGDFAWRRWPLRAARFALLLTAAFPRTGYCQGKNATAQIALCRTNYERKHYAEAVRSCNEAATQGNADAQALLGYMYANGVGVKQDYTEAFNWYREAAAQRNAAAQANLGGMYGSGLGVKQDCAEAFTWYGKAAAQGNAAAQAILGVISGSGRIALCRTYL